MDDLAFHTTALRMATFRNWPVFHISPRDMAASGFIYGGYQDLVTCIFCGGILGHWEVGDEPDTEHRRWFPDCTFLPPSYEQCIVSFYPPSYESLTF